jgi:hypothetical protein
MKIETMLLLVKIASDHKKSKDLEFLDGPKKDAIDYLISNGLISFCSFCGNHFYEVTDRGFALIEHWLETPLPVATWKIER